MVLGGIAAACGTKTPDGKQPVDCISPSDGGSATGYCLVEPVVLRVAGAKRLTPGQASLTNVDDSTAVIVARDAKGFHALSAICTHACCLVSLCNDALCSDATTNPGACGTTPPEAAPSSAGIVCPCHGSGFRIDDGSPIMGPAKRPLPSFALSFDGDDALVDIARTVDASVRV